MKRTLSAILLMSLLLSLSACAIPTLPRTKTESDPEEIPEVQEIEPAVIIPGTPEPTPAPTPDPYADKPDIDINSWEFQLTNSYNSIGEYQPPYSVFEGQGINENIVEQATAFVKAAREAGFSAYCSTILRNYEFQDSHYKSFVYNQAADAVDAANRMLGPGLSDHQTGLAIDFTDDASYNAFYGSFDDAYMKDTELYQWLVEHCTEYGFILRYPEGKEAFYGTPCNHPAHFRYVGKEAAAYMKEHDLCLEEFIILYDPSKVFLPQP